MFMSDNAFAASARDRSKTMTFFMSGVALSALLMLAACDSGTETTDKGGDGETDTTVTRTEERKDVFIDGVEMATEEDVAAAEAPADAALNWSIHKARPQMAVGGVQMPPQPRPGDINRDRFEDFEQNPVKLVSDEPVSTFSVDVDTASYSVMRKSLNMGSLPARDSVRVEEMINYFDYDYALPENKSEPFKINTHLYGTPWNTGTQLLHVGIKGYDIVPETQPDSNLVLLLDVSGSMNQPDKLPLLKSAMKMLVNEMGENDTISIVVYAGAAGTVLEPTKGSETAKILGALDRLSAGGSTAGGEGIRQAYALAEQNFKEDAVNRVILATDGDFNVGINDPERLEDFVAEKRDTGVFLTVLGFGRGNYNDVLMQKLAQSGNGNAAYIDSIKEARKVLVDEMSGTLFTIAKDVKIQVEFNPAQVAEYRLIGYETRMLNREDFNNDKVDAGDIGSGHSVTALYEIVPVGSDAQLNEPLRYGDKSEPVTNAQEGEVAFVRVRYKLPDEETNKLIEAPIMSADARRIVDDTPEDVRFATAVAAFGQKLKGGKYIGDMRYGDILSLAQGGKGDDPFGYRAEFMQLVRLAESSDAMPTLEQVGGSVTQ